MAYSLPKTVVIGSSGLVGSFFLKQIATAKEKVFSPGSHELDIANLPSIKEYLSQKKPKVIINFAGHTNLEEAETQRGNKDKSAWTLNVKGAQNLAHVCKTSGIFLIHISTDGVFPGNKDLPGPYSENVTPPDNHNQLSWYGYTKLMGEKAISENGVPAAIVRISYPFGNPQNERDFVRRIIAYLEKGYPLFADQKFTPTYLKDLISPLLILATQRKSGVYHIATTQVTTPLEFGTHVANLLNMQTPKKGSVQEYLKKPGVVPRAKLGGLTTRITESSLNIRLHSLYEALEECIRYYKPFLTA